MKYAVLKQTETEVSFVCITFVVLLCQTVSVTYGLDWYRKVHCSNIVTMPYFPAISQSNYCRDIVI